jgi:nitrate reductase NapAB chaperone NapD
MPISGILLNCLPAHLRDVQQSIAARSLSEVREVRDGALIVVTDTTTLKEDRAEVEALGALDGVVATHVVFSNIEDIADAKAEEKE